MPLSKLVLACLDFHLATSGDEDTWHTLQQSEDNHEAHSTFGIFALVSHILQNRAIPLSSSPAPMSSYHITSNRHSSAHHCYWSSPSSSSTRSIPVWRKSRSTAAASRAAQTRTRHESKQYEAWDRYKKAILERCECADR